MDKSCYYCHGSGVWDNPVNLVKMPCPCCTGDGIGADESGWVRCTNCGGTGKVLCDTKNGEATMTVDFNNARLQAILAYNRLCKTLNTSIRLSGSGIITVDADDLQKHMDDLHNMLATIGCTFDEGNKEFVCVLTDDVTLENFNPVDDELVS